MNDFLDFLAGPVFRICFALMVLGLLRAFALSIGGVIVSMRHAHDWRIADSGFARQVLHWFFPAHRIVRVRPFYSIISFVWHIGLILVPLFYSAHVLLWRQEVGFAWPAIPQTLAHVLTLTVIAGSFALVIGRMENKVSRFVSTPYDYLWPLWLTIPFATGFLTANVSMSAGMYTTMITVHLISANLTMLAIPFTKMAHPALFPLGQVSTAAAWKLVPGAGDRILATLNQPLAEETEVHKYQQHLEKEMAK